MYGCAAINDPKMKMICCSEGQDGCPVYNAHKTKILVPACPYGNVTEPGCIRVTDNLVENFDCKFTWFSRNYEKSVNGSHVSALARFS